MPDSTTATPGPWRIGNCESYDAYTGKPFRNVWAGEDEEARVIARTIENYNDDVDANARLIAAAPDLLAALKRLLGEGVPFQCDVETCECGENGDGYDDAGRACEHIQACRAIAKAKGE